MRKLILPLLVFASIVLTTNCANAESKITKETITPFPFEVEETLKQVEINHIVLNVQTKTKYANCETAIYDRPILDDTYIHDHSLVNTSFEVIEQNLTWSTITTSDGFAYILTKDLSDKPVEIKSYTEEELYIMAHLLAGECQSYPDEEQRYVGSVALNRVKDPRYPNTLKQVVFQKGQYACTWDGNYYRTPTEANWRNAKWLLENGSVLPDHVVFQSGSKQGKGVYEKTKWHYYCY